jgi:hypothetical protein
LPTLDQIHWLLISGIDPDQSALEKLSLIERLGQTILAAIKKAGS